LHEVVQGAVHVHHDPHVPHSQGQSHGEVQEGHEAHKLISMNRRLFWMHLEVLEAVQGAVHIHHDPHVPHSQGQSHGEVQEGHEAHQIDQHKQEVVLDAL
jgi:hypothetical protein